MTPDPLEHAVTLELASGAKLTLLYFSDREQRWIFAYDYVGEKTPGREPDLVNQVRLVANYEAGRLTSAIELSMHIVIPERLGRQFIAGVDISPGAKTYLEFIYRAPISYTTNRVGGEFRLSTICKGARDRVNMPDVEPALIRPIEFPFPVPDRLPIDGQVRVPFLTNQGALAHFDLPTETLR